MSTITQLAAAVAEERGLTDPLEGILWEDTPILWPGSCYVDGILYMTFPRDRLVDVTNKKGEKIGEKREKRTICIPSEGDPFWYDEETVAKKNYTFPSTFLQTQESRWDPQSIQNYLSDKVETPTIDAAALWSQIRAQLVTYVEYNGETFYDIVAYYVMLSYVFRMFDAIGYLHFNGTMASGKSQNLRMLTLMGFNTIWASNLSPSSMFRTIAGAPGVTCIDEAESFEGERGQELQLLLHAGYTNPGYALRVEKEGDKFTVKSYATYGPKAMASINPLPPVLASRAVVIPMQPASKIIPSLNPKAPIWGEIRNQCYLWAFQNAHALGDLVEEWGGTLHQTIPNDLKDRAWEVSMPFIVLAEHIGGRDMAIELLRFFEKYFEEAREQQATVDRQLTLLRCLPRVFANKEPYDGHWWNLKDIHEVVLEWIEEDAREYYKTRTASRNLTALGWRTRRNAHGGVQIPITEDEVREQFRKRRVTTLTDQDELWLTGKISYTKGKKQSTPEQDSAPRSIWEQITDDADADTPDGSPAEDPDRPASPWT